jgi:hypothetical protein
LVVAEEQTGVGVETPASARCRLGEEPGQTAELAEKLAYLELGE